MTAAFDHDITEQLLIRPMTQSDENFIYNSWLKSFWSDGSLPMALSREIYFPRHHKVVERILDQAATQVLIASLKDDEATILGYLVAQSNPEFDILHYIYVKHAFQRFGIAKALLSAADFDLSSLRYTHQPRVKWAAEKLSELIYDPYLL